MNNENRNEEAVSPVIATILMVAITVVLAGVLYVWASSLADDSTGGGLDKYQFDDRDAAGTMSDAAGEKLVHIKMVQGDDLDWSVLKVSIVVDGGASIICAESSVDDGTADCTYDTDGDNYWSVPEEITINEGDVDLCDGANGGCDVEVVLTGIGVANGDDKVLATVTAYADAGN